MAEPRGPAPCPSVALWLRPGSWSLPLALGRAALHRFCVAAVVARQPVGFLSCSLGSLAARCLVLAIAWPRSGLP
eukprot:13214328-Alexandrium_andersonii.AAC.1